MILALLGVPMEQPNLLIDHLIPKQEQAIVEQVIPELTVEEKIKANYYQCNTDTHWIRKDDATCKEKQQTTRTAIKPATGSQNGLNGYESGSCTGHVASLRYVPSGWGNAISWKAGATKAGWYVGDVPQVGAIGWRGNHVVYVVAVNETTVTISEANYRFVRYETRTIDKPINYYTYLY